MKYKASKTSHKLRMAMGVLSVVSAAGIAGCDQSPPSETGQINESRSGNTDVSAGQDFDRLASMNNGEGEGEGSSGPASLADDDIAYLTQLGLMRGHLLVGHALYQQGHQAAAKTHMKHPRDELYAAMLPAFEARNTEGFGEQLTQLSHAVESDDSSAAVDAAYARLSEAIAHSETAVSDKTRRSASQQLMLTANLLETAAEEYAIGVEEGKLVNAHEYQDAYGFTQIAKQTVEQIDASGDPQVQKAVETAANLIAGLAAAWPELMPPETLETDASELYRAASRIELLAADLE